MTTTKTLIAKAEAYEERARALRIAAAELNGHLTNKATATLPARLAKAAALRASQHPRTPSRLSGEERRAIVAAIVDARGTYRLRELYARAQAEGYDRSLPTLNKDLREMGWHPTGQTNASQWTSRRRSGAPKTGSKTTTKAATIRRQRVATARLLQRIANHDGPVPAAFFKGYQTSPAVLVRHGYLTRTGDGFARTEKPFAVEGSRTHA